MLRLLTQTVYSLLRQVRELLDVVVIRAKHCAVTLTRYLSRAAIGIGYLWKLPRVRPCRQVQRMRTRPDVGEGGAIITIIKIKNSNG